jgi:hypothetical protein
MQIGGRLTALVENTKTGQGDFGAEGEHLFGMKVASISRGRVELRARDGKTYALRMGEKEIADTAVAPSAPSATSPTGPGQPRPGQPGGGFGFGRPRFDPERFRQWMDTLPPERRALIEQRMRERRQRGGGMPGG